jgi:chemotaxis protein methyltransferase CheR
MLLNKHDFDILTGKIKDYSGIVVTDDKEYLLESRLMPMVRKYGLGGLADLVGYMQENKDDSLLIEIIENMTTNESFFFRDFKPFDALRDKILPEIFAKHPEKNTFRIWSAASSTGQEAYSIAMTILESASCAGKQFEIIGTDIDLKVIEKAREGLYSQFEVQRGVSISLLLRYFTQEGDQWRVKEPLQRMVRFDQFNLLDSAGGLGIFDVVFCRNVLIYFDNPTKEKVLATVAKAMEPYAFLLTGGAESLMGINSPFKAVGGLGSVFKFT